MSAAPRPPHLVRFGVFEVDLQAGELRKAGMRQRLVGQPFLVLQFLLEHPQQIVTREELRNYLWPQHTYVDYELALKRIVNRLREALGDSAETPRFIETIPRRGYRFIAPLSSNGDGRTGSESLPDSAAAFHRRLHLRVVLGIAAAAILGAALAFTLSDAGRGIFGTRATHQFRSLAVLPLENLSGDPAQEYFSDGMTDALVTELAQIRSLKVTARTSVLHYKKTNKTPREIARELMVDGIVEGSVQRSGNHLRTLVQLIHGPTDELIWAKSYDGSLSDILQLEDTIALDIAEELSVNLSIGSEPAGAVQHGFDFEAYDDFLKGRNYARRWTRDDLVNAIEFLQRSIQRNPNYAPAYAELSYANEMFALLGIRPSAEVVPKAKAAAITALALDEREADAHIVLGLIHGAYERNYPAEENELERAIQVDPNSSEGHAVYSNILALSRRNTEAIREINTALEIDPFSPLIHTYASFVFLGTGQYDAGLEEGRRAVAIEPGFANGHMVLAGALGAKGMFKEGFAEWLQFLILSGDGELARELGTAATKISLDGDPGHKLAYLTVSYYLKKSKTEYVSPMMLAQAYIDLGERDKALQWLNKAYEERTTDLRPIAINPYFDCLRSDHRFQDLLHRMNLPSAPPNLSTRSAEVLKSN